MSWIQEFNSTFFLSVGSVLLGALGLSAKYCLKSKCSDFTVCWGLFSIKRNVELEVKEELRELELGKKDDEEEKE
jgi:hypothetical protein